jgi:UDP-N-acetylmuramoyl-tripeptide--D-alanyl-D-alanine ligase
VGSYGKTSVKNILKTILSEKYSVVATPSSFNTPGGIARTVCSAEFADKEIFIAEMGARKRGDIQELCTLVQPTYGIFTGVCRQHIETFGSLENVYEEKSEILKCGAKKVVCSGSLKEYIPDEQQNAVYACGVEDLHLEGRKTAFTLLLGEEKMAVKTALLGRTAAENISLAATLAFEMGLTKEEIARGIEKLEQVPHRLELIENQGVYILDDAYNCNIVGASSALEVLGLFEGGKCVVTPGIVECGILEEELNGELGKRIAEGNFDKVILVGDTLVGAVKDGYVSAGGRVENLSVVKTLGGAQALIAEWVQKGDCVLFLNDLPDVY